MFKLFNLNKKTPTDIPLLIESTLDLPDDSDAAPQQEHTLFIQAIKILIEHYQHHIENPMDLMRLLSVNRETYQLYQANIPLMRFITSEKIFSQFKLDMLNEFQKRERGPFDKLAAATHSFNSLPLPIVLTTGTALLLILTGLLIGTIRYGSMYTQDTHAFSYPYYTISYQTNVGLVTNMHWYEPELDTEFQAKKNKDLAGTIGCAVTAGLLLLATSIVFMTYLLKSDKLQAAFNSRNNAEIKALENAIRTTISNTTKTQSESPNYQQWLKHYLWNEKVNQPVGPVIPDDVEAQPALGM